VALKYQLINNISKQTVISVREMLSAYWRSAVRIIITIVKTTSEVGDGDGRRDWLASDGGRGRSGSGRHTLRCEPARSRRWAVEVRVFTLHTRAGWAWWRASTGGRSSALSLAYYCYKVRYLSCRVLLFVYRMWSESAQRFHCPASHSLIICHENVLW